jgi:hypothetical protein
MLERGDSVQVFGIDINKSTQHFLKKLEAG